MKILIIKNENSIPLEVQKKHIDKIKSIDKKLEINEVFSSNLKEIEKHLQDAEIVSGTPNLIPSLEKARKLKWVNSFSAGVDNLLTEHLKNSEILVTNSSGIHAIPIAEHVIGFMLIFVRKFYETFKKQQKKEWIKNQDLTELYEKTVLIVGLGHIGSEIARIASSFGTKVIAVKQNLNNKPEGVSEVYSINDLDKILAQVDFVVSSLPLTNDTKYLFDTSKFEKMKKSAIFINIGRGGLVNEKDLIEALDKKIIAGAGLDVTEEEPLPPTSPLWEMENVILTPHHSGWSERYMDRAIDLFCINLKAYLKGEKMPNLVDKNRGY